MRRLHNVFACLVHERRDSVADLVRNLRALDPGSTVLLYDGGRDPGLLRGLVVDGEPLLVHPDPSPQRYGALHGFAIDCMRFAAEAAPFDTLTIVDSDQLAVRRGYSARLAEHLADSAQIGMLGNAPGPQPRETRLPTPAAAWEEIGLWRPFLRRFAGGEGAFPHWTFWPSTVFTAPAARDLVRQFDTDDELQWILSRTRLFATEEIVLPTLVALLGHAIARSPFSYAFVRFNARYTSRQLASAFQRPDVYWLHPVPRRDDDPLRRQVRARFGGYEQTHTDGGTMVTPRDTPARNGLMLTIPILRRMREIDGWLDDEEADLLLAAISEVVHALPADAAIVEVGSYCGRSTVVLAGGLAALRDSRPVHAVDPHEGELGAADLGIEYTAPTLDSFCRNIANAGLGDHVRLIRSRSYETAWDAPIGLLLIDGLHDYDNVARDFAHFERHVVDGGLVAFHDYADYYPGVQAFVDELLAGGGWTRMHLAASMMLVRRTGVRSKRARRARRRRGAPLVTCVMPTFDRPEFVPRAVASFLRQEHERAELLVLDDGDRPVDAGLMDDERIRYMRLEERMTIGAKRNLGVHMARGELVANWDDDDWDAPWRLTYQVESMQTSGADVCGLDHLLYLDPAAGAAWEYIYPRDGQPWVGDNTLCYTRSFALSNPFPDSDFALDIRFLWSDRPKRVIALEDNRFHVGLLHPGNTSPKDTTQPVWRPLPIDVVHAVMGDDLAAYLPRAALA